MGFCPTLEQGRRKEYNKMIGLIWKTMLLCYVSSLQLLNLHVYTSTYNQKVCKMSD